jgi:hypothetical protein
MSCDLPLYDINFAQLDCTLNAIIFLFTLGVTSICRDGQVIPDVNIKCHSGLRVAIRCGKMTSPGGNITAIAFHTTKIVKKAEELTLSL